MPNGFRRSRGNPASDPLAHLVEGDASQQGVSNVVVIESGAYTPSPATLERLLQAADYRPGIALRDHAEEILGLAEQVGLHHVRVFGSVARGEDHYSSDLDLLVDIRPEASVLAAYAFPELVKHLVGFDVDMVVDEGDSPYLPRIRAEAVAL